MSNLNSKKARRQVAELITDYSFYSEWKAIAYQNGTKEDNDTITQDMVDAQYIYYSFMRSHTEMLLARMDIFLYGDLTKKRLNAYNWDNYHSEFNPLLDEKNRTEHIYNSRLKEVA